MRTTTRYLLPTAALGLAAGALAPHHGHLTVFWSVVALAGAAAIAAAVRVHRPASPGFWLALVAALGAWGLASVALLAAHAAGAGPGAKAAQLVYLPGYACLGAAGVLLLRGLGVLRWSSLDAAIGALTLTALLWPLVLASGTKTTALFPLVDIVLLMLLLRVLFSPSAALLSVRLLGAALTLLVLCDAEYYTRGLAGGIGTRVLAGGYAAAYALAVAAGVDRSMREVPLPLRPTDEPPASRSIAVLGSALVAVPIAMLADIRFEPRAVSAALVAISAVITVLVLVRIARLVRRLDVLRERAAASERRFRMVFDSAGLGISIGADGMLTETNPAYQQMLGYEGDELAGMHYLELTHPEDRHLDRDAVPSVMVGDLECFSFEKRYVRKDGSVFWGDVTLTRSSDGTFGISLIDDITERKALEESLRHAQKMEAVGRLAGGVAHDFNNLMTAVTGHAGLLQDELGPGDPRRQRLDVIEAAAARAANLTRQLLAFSRRLVLRPQPTDLAEIVSGFETILRGLIPENVGLRLELEGGAVARVDRAQLEQVILNLALNAVDAMPAGGRLTIAVRRDGTWAELTVADTGHGMDEETLAHAFEPFFTTKDPASGTGLGLSTVDGIVDLSGGTVAVESTPGAGCTFRIRLPLVADTPRVQEADHQGTASAAGRGRVLLAEDEELVRRVTAEMLRRLGYEVVTAASGEEALALLEDGTPAPDVLVTDVVMTGIDGGTLARKARRLVPGLPVLFISGYTGDALGHRTLAEGEPVLAKPFTPSQLAEQLAALRS